MSTVSDDRRAIDAEVTRLRSLDQLAAEHDHLEEDDGQRLLNFGTDLNLKLKGQNPTGSELKIKSISLPIRGQLGDAGDDETVTVLVTARLDELRIVNRRASDGGVAAKTRRHVLTPISVVPVDGEQADRLLGLE